MENVITTHHSKSKIIINRLGWAFLILLGGSVLIFIAFPYLQFTESVYERFWTIKWWVLGHVIGGSIAMITGPFQFWAAFRNKYLALHRKIGYAYLISILFAVICSFVMASTTALAISWQWALSLTILGVAWIITTVMAFRFIKLKNIPLHKEWMIRSYVVTFAFVTFRVLVALGMMAGLGDFPDVAPTAMWASWSIPLLITEVCLQWNKK